MGAPRELQRGAGKPGAAIVRGPPENRQRRSAPDRTAGGRGDRANGQHGPAADVGHVHRHRRRVHSYRRRGRRGAVAAVREPVGNRRHCAAAGRADDRAAPRDRAGAAPRPRRVAAPDRPRRRTRGSDRLRPGRRHRGRCRRAARPRSGTAGRLVARPRRARGRGRRAGRPRRLAAAAPALRQRQSRGRLLPGRTDGTGSGW
jgi:hypothetical protein